jgi:hypothetical protein
MIEAIAQGALLVLLLSGLITTMLSMIADKKK